jgi:hypothetical protein
MLDDSVPRSFGEESDESVAEIILWDALDCE